MKNVLSLGSVTFLATTLALCGCSHHDAPTLTPHENPATPTYRSTVNSYELNTAPRYTQSGVNGGEPATLPAIPSPDRYSQNTPLATAVYNTVRVDSSIDSRYLTIYSKGGTVKLTGTVKKKDLSKILKLVHTQPGLKNIDDSELQLESG
jgi:hypothetical protein